MKDELSNEDHKQMLDNPGAASYVSNAAYKGYIKIGISHEDALRLLGITEDKNDKNSHMGEEAYWDDMDDSLEALPQEPTTKPINAETKKEDAPPDNSYLESLSTDELNRLYAATVRTTGNNEPPDVLKTIEKIIASRIS